MIVIDLDWQEDRKKFTWIDEGYNEIEKGEIKKGRREFRLTKT